MTARAPKTVNGELSVLRQVLRHARLWYRFQEDYRALKNTKPPVGLALTDDDQKRLFAAARSKPEWIFAYVASALAFYCGLRACEIRGLQWKHIDWDNARIQIRRSKTPAGWRDPSLNEACARALKELHSRAKIVGFDDPEHYLFPWHGRDKKIDPSRPMTTWRSAWRSLRRAAGLDHVRFHDGRHTALTRLAEKGQPDWVIQAQMGHVSPAMMRTYSHIRRKALDEAAAALEPSFKLKFPRHTRGLKPTLYESDVNEPALHATCDRLMSQFTSQWDDLKKAIARTRTHPPEGGWPSKARQKETGAKPGGFGSPHWTMSATGCGWAWRPAKENENRGLVRMAAGSGEIEISHGASEAEQLFDPERA